jgi:hypothetical protein
MRYQFLVWGIVIEGLLSYATEISVPSLPLVRHFLVYLFFFYSPVLSAKPPPLKEKMRIACAKHKRSASFLYSAPPSVARMRDKQNGHTKKPWQKRKSPDQLKYIPIL